MKTACLAPWIHLHALPNEDVYPCCSTSSEPEAFIGSLHLSDLKTLWNSPKLREIRKAMLREESLEICKACDQRQKAGLNSQRSMLESQFAHHRAKISGETPSINSIVFLDFRFSNACNLACKMCCPKDSTGWNPYCDNQDQKVFNLDTNSNQWAYQLRDLLPNSRYAIQLAEEIISALESKNDMDLTEVKDYIDNLDKKHNTNCSKINHSFYSSLLLDTHE